MCCSSDLQMTQLKLFASYNYGSTVAWCVCLIMEINLILIKSWCCQKVYQIQMIYLTYLITFIMYFTALKLVHYISLPDNDECICCHRYNTVDLLWQRWKGQERRGWLKIGLCYKHHFHQKQCIALHKDTCVAAEGLETWVATLKGRHDFDRS